MPGTIKRSCGAHLEEVKACRVETKENTRAKAKVIFRSKTGFMELNGADRHE